jgi:hypothetical protein
MLAQKDRGAGVGKSIDPARGLLSGLFKCETCGAQFFFKRNTIRRPSGRLDRYGMYMCDNARRKWGESCKAKMLNQEDLDAAVWQLVEDFTADPRAFLKKAVAAASELGKDIAGLEAREKQHSDAAAAIDAEVAEVWEQQKANAWPMSWVSPRLNELNKRRKAEEAKLDQVRKERTAAGMDREQVEGLTASLATLRQRIKQATFAEKHAGIRQLVKGGSVRTVGKGHAKRARITIEFRWGQTVYTPDCPKTGLRADQGMHTVSVEFDCVGGGRYRHSLANLQ